MVRLALRLYDGLVFASAGLAAALLGVAPILMIIDAMMRLFNLQPPLWVVPVSEYILLYSAMLPAPWLVRTAGHVQVEILLERLPITTKAVFEPVLYLVCATLCGVFAWYGVAVTVEAVQFGEVDMRAITIPALWYYSPIAFGFVLMTTEFVRLAMLRRSTLPRARVEVGM